MRGLVTAALESELRLKVKRHGIVVWLDADSVYTELVDALAASTNQDMSVVGYRGSALEARLRLEPLMAGADKPRLVLHVPGLSQEQVEQSPLCEVVRAGSLWRKRLDTAIGEAAAGRARPEQVAELVARKPTLADADAWLGELVDAASAGIRSQLRALSLPALVDDLIARGAFAQRLGQPDDRAALVEHVEATIGWSQPWRDETLTDERVDTLVFSIASFSLAVEYVFDLKRAPQAALLQPLTTLSRPLRDGCRALAGHLRERHAELYQRVADETEAALADEVAAAEAADLGRVDTFRFEEDKLLDHALTALELGDYEVALDLAESRAEAESIWTKQPSRRSAWLIVRDAGRLGRAVAAAGVPKHTHTIEELVAEYVARGAAVDRAHRVLEQRRAAALFPDVPYFQRIKARADAMREVWVEWADAWAKAMAEVCRTRGFLPAPPFMQRTVFDAVVVPLVRDAKDPRTGADLPTALFVVDALRFEMAEELFREMDESAATTATLKPRLAELPTLTAVGMNALAPVSEPGGGVPLLRPVVSGDKKLAIEGFSAGSYRVTGRPQRFRAMFDRVGGDGVEMSLDAVVSEDAAALKRKVARARLVVVHSLELDDAGESGVGALVFDQVLQKLRAAWRLLREANVRRFVITSDHGFLLLDGLVRAPEVQGRKVDPERRHMLTKSAATEPGRVRVALSELGYVGADGVSLIMSETTNVFDRGGRGAGSGGFVHGGNSLQERVIPVLTVVHRSAAGGNAARYRIEAAARPPVGGMHCVSAEVRLDQSARSQMSLAFAQPNVVDLTLRVAGGDGTVDVVQTRDGAELVGTSLRATVGKPFEVFFRVGAAAERVQVELVGDAAIEPATIAEWFTATSVTHQAREARETRESAQPAPRSASWLDAVTADYRPIYEHIQTHGAVSEVELGALLAGGPRAARKFAREVDGDLPKLPFVVRVEVGPDGKRWVREGTHDGGDR